MVDGYAEAVPGLWTDPKLEHSGAVNNDGGESAPVRFTRPSSRKHQKHGVRGTWPSARRQMDSISGIREEGGYEIGAVGRHGGGAEVSQLGRRELRGRR